MAFRYTLSLLGILLTLAFPARAQIYLEFFELPGEPSLHGLDYHDGSLWVAVRSSSDPHLLQIDPADGTVVGTVPITGDFRPIGMA